MKKQIEVDCPCCESRLSIDVLTQRVTRAIARAELDELGQPKQDGKRWERAAERVADRVESAPDKLDSALDAERNKSSRYDELFDDACKKARKKVQDREDEGDFPD
ncbi:MAG: hypothetical protein ABGY71_13870 [bacterium]|jgi:hypothetical protein|nr:hypothetical protein [Planctomycetota bacterium]HIL50788.1 hypothetical protein [Planctomycetota bacterium]